MTTLRFTEQDRDEQGFVRVAPMDTMYEESRRAIVGDVSPDTAPHGAAALGAVPSAAAARRLAPALQRYGPWIAAVLLAAAALLLLGRIAAPPSPTPRAS